MEKLTIPKVLEVEAHGLSITSSAHLLNVSPQYLNRFIKKNAIDWRGRSYNKRMGEVNPHCNYQKAKKLGICHMTIHKRMEKHWITFDEAAAMQKRKHTRLTIGMIKQAVALRETGKFWKEISLIIGVDKDYLAKKVREYQNGKTD